MMKIAFYLQNKNIKDVDCTNVINGNPGIGGSEYALILVASQLAERDNSLDVCVFSQATSYLPATLALTQANDFENAVEKAAEMSVNVLVVDYKYLDSALVQKYAAKLKFVVWAHNFISTKDYSFYAKQPNVLRIVHVGKEQMDLYIDHPAYSKSDFIYNPYPVSGNNVVGSVSRGHDVVYIGSLVKEKGFDLLAKSWKKILKIFPDANLYVVGSGHLYNRNTRLGKWGFADEEFENEFMKHLTVDNQILPSVHFMGILGEEKKDLLLKCKVGVPNPSGVSETFGYTALEMQDFGCVVTTIRCPGYLDTVCDKNNLYARKSQLFDYLTKALNTTKVDSEDRLFMSESFSIEQVIPQWEKLFSMSIQKNESYKVDLNCTNSNYRLKWLKFKMRWLKDKYPFLDCLPPVEQLIQYAEKPGYYKKRLFELLSIK